MNGKKIHPALFHGILGGLVVMAAKLVLAYTGNWTIKLGGGFNMLAFLMVMLAVIFAGMAIRKIAQSVNYGRALLHGLITVSVVVFIAQIGEQIAYRTKPGLAQVTKEFQIETMNKEMGKVKLFSGAFKEKMITELEKMEPSDIYGMVTFVGNVFTYIILDMLFVLVLAIFLRKTPDPLKQELME
ncbi:MAG: DUF4199 domain-containing protein [Bacteroidetes bacterium]|nr:DUF4199 domain-containing protein [Bacteroidota bacterium]